MVKIKISFIDGGYYEYQEDNPAFLRNLKELTEQGYTGKALIHALITDDWGPPPKIIQIEGSDSKGKIIDVIIPYS